MAAPTIATRAPARTRGAMTPSLDELRAWLQTTSERPTTIPIYREIMADVETPVSAYLKVREEGRSGFILESVEGGERIARYSFIGAGSLRELTMRDGVAVLTGSGGTVTTTYVDPLKVVEEMLAPYQSVRLPGLPLPRFLGGAVGYLSYECVRSWEPRVGEAAGVGRGLPDSRFALVDSLLVFDHVERTIKAVAHVHLDGQTSLDAAYAAAADRVDDLVTRLRSPLASLPLGGEPVDIPAADRSRPNTAPERYREIVETAKEYIRAGDIFQVVLSQRVDLPTPAHPFTIYRALRTVNPSPYMFYLDFGDHQIVGASPELLVRLENGIVTNHP
ncbi:MAG: chorismate-binding protein, partial [Thermomicrobiales bacterium]|nr:chorismate-binding protein [Thermomicrobiales bacterium]